jgi:hypothetical protein
MGTAYQRRILAGRFFGSKTSDLLTKIVLPSFHQVEKEEVLKGEGGQSH